MNSIRFSWTIKTLAVCGLLLLSACQVIDEDASAVKITVAPRIQTPMPQSPSPLAPIEVVVATDVHSETSLLPATPSPNVMATGTTTPIPTLPPEAARARIQELFETNGGCQFPCVLGIVPGETDWQTAYSILKPIADKVTRRGLPNPYALEVEFDSLWSDSWGRQTYDVSEGVVQRFGGGTGLTTPFSPASVLQTYGPPTEVFLAAGGDYSGSGTIPFTVLLFYPQHKFWISYGTNATAVNGNFAGCFFDHSNPPPEGISASPIFSAAPYLDTWADDNLYNLLDVPTTGFSPVDPEYLVPLAKATDLDVASFHEMFSYPDTPLCLETPLECFWQVEMSPDGRLICHHL